MSPNPEFDFLSPRDEGLRGRSVSCDLGGHYELTSDGFGPPFLADPRPT